MRTIMKAIITNEVHKVAYEVRKVIDAYESLHGLTPNVVILPYNVFSVLKLNYIKTLGQNPKEKWTIFGIDVIVATEVNAKIQCHNIIK